ncbi:MAG: LysM peptidoglycan-binding domain-containing protein [Clostridia bacterium]|nr:LysM peptidoglycan-binding domain-containing protein [Clostridia bacterium]
MSKLLFLFDESSKFCVRINEKGFYNTCEEFDVAPSKIIFLNNLDSEPPNGRLIMIERKDNSFLYTVKPGDTIEDICARFLITKEELFSTNKIEYIFPYQKIELPIN